MLTKYHEVLMTIVAYRGVTRLPLYLTFALGLEIIKVYMLTKYHEVLMTNVAYRRVTRLSLYLTP